MLVVLGIAIVLVFLMLCGGSHLDEKRTEKQRLDLSLGMFVFIVVLAAIVGLALH